MNAERLLALFERISEAPDAISKLRPFILNLAVRGKLVEQRVGEDLSDHLEFESELPFEIPATWRIARLGGIFKMVNGRAFKSSDWITHGLPIVRIQNLNNATAPFNCCDPDLVEEKHLIDTGAFLISWSGTPGTSFGAFIWERGLAALNQHIFKCYHKTKAYSDSFLQIAINGRLDELIKNAHGGVGLQHVTKGKLEALTLPLPPLTEQHRIVAKVDELMALCDKIETARQVQRHGQKRLVTASLQSLSKPDEDPKIFRQQAAFALQAFPQLTTTAAEIKHLRNAIKLLGVQGRLSGYSAHDETIESLMASIREAQKQAITNGAIKRSTLLSNLRGAAPFPIPSHWNWLPLGSLIIRGPQNGISPKETTNPDAPKALTLAATTTGKLRPQYFKRVDLRLEQAEPYWLSEGDLLFQRGNTREYVGMAAIYDIPMSEFIFPDLIIRLRLAKVVSLSYIHLVLTSPPLREYFSSRATGSSETMPKINQKILCDAPIPLPPLAEQHRIVAKVDELTSLCDQLEKQLNDADQASSGLLDSVLRGALSEL